MIHVSDEEFGELVEQAVADIPARYAQHLNNLAFRVDEEPSREQLEDGIGVHGRGTLLGLYQGIPLPARTGGYSGVVPDVITVFKRPHEYYADTLEGLRREVHQTVWHEVAHYFGLDHGQIHSLER